MKGGEGVWKIMTALLVALLVVMGIYCILWYFIVIKGTGVGRAYADKARVGEDFQMFTLNEKGGRGWSNADIG